MSITQIGVDLVSVNSIPRGIASTAEYLKMFADYFTDNEMRSIKRFLQLHSPARRAQSDGTVVLCLAQKQTRRLCGGST